MIEIEHIISNVKELPTFPASVTRLAKMLNNEDYDASDVEQVIRPDMTLTANLLKLANSAYFGFSREITSVRQTVSLMGIKRVFEMAASCSLAAVIPKLIPGYQIRAASFCLHSIATAVYAERLADLSKKSVPDLLFTTGLLHDIGKLVMGHFLEQEQSSLNELITTGEISMVEAERAILGLDHGEIGSIMSQVWNLPPAIELVTRWHHQPNQTSVAEYQSMIDLVHVSDNIAHLVGFGDDFAGLLRKLDPEPVERLKLTPQIIQKLVLETTEEIRDLAKLIIAPGY